MNFLMVYPNSTGNTKVPMGIIYLLTILKNAGHNVKLFDMTFYGLELDKHDINIRGKMLNFKPVDLLPYGVTYQKASMGYVDYKLIDDVENFKPDLVGVSITEDTSGTGFRMADIIKKQHPEIPIIFGGVFCLACPEYVISQPCVDMMAIGDGEELILHLAARIDSHQDYSDIPGLWTKTTRNEMAKPICLDTLPFMDLSLVDKRHLPNPMAGHVYKMTFIQSQRGCPRRCTYCCNQLFLNTYQKAHKGTYLRKQNIERFVDEMAYQKKTHGLNFYQIIDDDFVNRPLNEIQQFTCLYKRYVDLPFWIQAEANHVTLEKMAALRMAGLMAVSMGIETGNDNIRENVYRRKTDKATTKEAFRIMHSLGIRTSGNIIIGVPYEGRKEIFDSIEFVRECEPKSLNVNIFTPYRGTELRKMSEDLGYISPDYIHSTRDSWYPILNMPQISNKEIYGLVRTFVLYSTLPKNKWGAIEYCEKNPEDTGIWSQLEDMFWEIAEMNGINVDIPGFDYDAIKEND